MKHSTASQSALGPGTGSPTGLPGDAPTSPLRPGLGTEHPRVCSTGVSLHPAAQRGTSPPIPPRSPCLSPTLKHSA